MSSYQGESPHMGDPDHGKSNFNGGLSPAFRVSPNSALGKVRAANAGKTNDQVENNTAAALGYTPPQKQRFNQR